MFSPAITAPADLATELKSNGFALLDARGLSYLTNISLSDIDAWKPCWEKLEPDHHLRDGGHYRLRRHSCFVINETQVEPVPHRAHFQSIDYNALHGGTLRWFEPLEPAMTTTPAWNRLLHALSNIASALRGPQRWFAEAHAFRINTIGGIGRPTPEGAHRDGVDLVAVILVSRQAIKGGETRVFEMNGPQGVRFTLSEPWSALILDDTRVIHESTPIQPLDPEGIGHRDTLVITLRSGGFQEPSKK